MKFFIYIIFFVFVAISANAQLCNGSLGDPIVNVTFGVDNAPLPANVTTYNYSPGCPDRGEYTINDFLFGCGARYPNPYGTWVPMTGDHTGDVDGNYMLVNAENNPGLVHVDTAKDLCANITYEYAAWLTNVMRTPWTCDGHPILPDLTFSVYKLDGTLIATYSTGEIPVTNQKQWKQYGFSYVNPPGVETVILKLEAKAPYGCGNGFALDDITFRQCSPVTATVSINGNTGPVNVCADYTTEYTMKGTFTNGFTDPSVIWQNSFDTGKTWNDIPGEITQTYIVPHRLSGVILYRMIVASKENINSIHCRIPSNIIYTEVHPLAEHKPPQELIGCIGEDLVMPEADPKALSILWTGPNGFKSSDYSLIIPDFNILDSGIYKLKENFYFGCVSLDTFYIKAFPGIKISVSPAIAVCEGTSQILSATSSIAGTFQWVPATGLSKDNISNPVANPKDSTIYKVTVTNSFGCKDSAEVPLNVYKNPEAHAGNDKTILTGDTAILNGSVSGTAIQYSWLPSASMNDNYTLHPNVFPSEETTYTLQTVSTVGCGSSADNVVVKVYKTVAIPNAFTPNGDGKNDVFRITPLDNYELKKFIIYNRLGTKIFESHDLFKGWDGTYNGLPLPTGTYVYYILMQNKSNKNITRQGTILLLR